MNNMWSKIQRDCGKNRVWWFIKKDYLEEKKIILFIYDKKSLSLKCPVYEMSQYHYKYNWEKILPSVYYKYV